MMHTTMWQKQPRMFSPSFFRHILRLLYLSFTSKQLIPHRPFYKHDLVPRDFDDELLERDFDHEFYDRDVIDDDLFDRFYDDLD